MSTLQSVDLNSVLVKLAGVPYTKDRALLNVLEVPKTILDESQESHPTTADQWRSDGLDWWIRNKNATWEVLAEALESPSVDEINLAASLRPPAGALNTNGNQRREVNAPVTASGKDFTKVRSLIVRPPPLWNNIEDVKRSQPKNGTYHLQFTFDHDNEKKIKVSVTKCAQELTFKIIKCEYLGVDSKSPDSSYFTVAKGADEAVFEDIVKESQLSESHRRFLVDNVISVVTKKIHYASHPPLFGIFLSHKSKDKPIINAVKTGLKFMGYTTWIDQEDIGVGEFSDAAIKSGIDRCYAFLAWMNEEYFKSDWCKGELKYALQMNKKIFTFGNHRELTTRFTEEFRKLGDRNIVDPSQKSLFEILRLIDEALHK